jgi:hypothetical protein
MIVAQQATEAVPPRHVPPLATTSPFRCDESVIEPLVIALRIIVHQVLTDDMVEASFTKYHYLIEGFLLHRAHEPFAMGVQIWALRW